MTAFASPSASGGHSSSFDQWHELDAMATDTISQRHDMALGGDCAVSQTVYLFTVRRADSVLEKWGSKKATIQLHVNLASGVLSLLSLDETHQSFPIKAITARPQSRVGIQLQIQSEETLITKKINFFGPEDRANFLDVLEHGKVLAKRGVALVPAANKRTDARTQAIQSDDFALLPGEAVLETVQRVTNLIVMAQSDRAVQGVLKITSYRITFSPYDSAWHVGAFEVPLSALDVITRDGLMLLIACKDLRTLRLAMHDAYTANKGYNELPATPDFKWLDRLTQRMRPPNMMGAVFAFDYWAEKKVLLAAKGKKEEGGWLLYSPVAEYQRLGFIGNNDRKEDADANAITWRLLKNSKFRFSPTYPQLMVVPSLMTEEQLVQSGRFRSRARLPVAVWKHPVNKCVLARSSQPNYGMMGNRSEPDRILLKAYRDSANTGTWGESPLLHIIDARDQLASTGNFLKGKGSENPHHYDNAMVEFFGISNLHKVRESYDALKKLILSDGKNFHSRLQGTKWLNYVIDILTGAHRIAEILHEDGASVLVHCSDGWNRTPQLVSLAELMLDPYYRTTRGFTVLIEKEWCAFGHKFADRIGVGKDATDEPHERSPIVLQFLDCVWQLTRQFPTAFEFNENLLLHISDALVSGLYGTFLYNTERERVFEKVWERTESAWTPVINNASAFTNPTYQSTTRVLYPRTDEASIVLWEAMVFRWDPSRQYYPPVTTGSIAGHNQAQHDALSDTADVDNDNQAELDRLSDSSDLSGFDKSIISDDIGRDVEDEPFDVVIARKMAIAKRRLNSIVQERERQREQARNIRVAATMATDHVRIKHLEQLLSESIQREQELEGQVHDAAAASDRVRQRAQARNIREAVAFAPDQSRIKYLEQLLSESMARDVALEELFLIAGGTDRESTGQQEAHTTDEAAALSQSRIECLERLRRESKARELALDDKQVFFDNQS